jgi:hypothetical protein
MRNIDTLKKARGGRLRVASVDLVLHLCEALYRNVGATDLLDFTLIRRSSWRSRG